MSTATTYRYVGTDRRGTAKTGVLESVDLRTWTEARWREGWRELVILDGPRRVVAEIGRANGRRIWWAEGGTRDTPGGTP
jgi:hypothetical protein